MRSEPNLRIEPFRRTDIIESVECMRTNTGAFAVRVKGAILMVVASDGMGWEHVSVSRPDRCPTWEEMSYIKSLWWRDDEWVVQFHPAERDYVNNHPYCLHLWKPIGVDMPQPPDILVGIKQLNPDEFKKAVSHV